MDEDEAKKLGIDNPKGYFKVQSDKGNFAPLFRQTLLRGQVLHKALSQTINLILLCCLIRLLTLYLGRPI